MNYKEELMSYEPTCAQEIVDKEVMLQSINDYGDLVLSRKCSLAHITASSIIFNKEKDKVLMIYHNIYKSWSWTGGHADDETDMLLLAKREAQEETGINDLKLISNGLCAVDVLHVLRHIKRGKNVNTHLHMNYTYCFEADESEAIRIKEDENSGVMWINIDDLSKYVTEEDMLPVYQKIINGIIKQKEE